MKVSIDYRRVVFTFFRGVAMTIGLIVFLSILNGKLPPFYGAVQITVLAGVGYTAAVAVFDGIFTYFELFEPRN